MSKKFLIPIDMTGLEIQNFLAHNLAAAPTGAEGKIYFNTADKKLYYYNGTTWVPVTEGSVYGSGTETDLTTGTSTTDKVWQPKILHDYIASALAGVDAMRFKGTIGTGGTVTTLPTSGVKVGDTYRVITAGTYAGQTCEVGDLIIATATTPTWTVAQTNIDGAITNITGTAPISVTGSGASRNVEIGAASGSAAGSMSAAHYTKLNGLTATKTGTVTISSGSTSATANVSDIISYTAKDASTGEEVVVDVAKGSSSVTFSIASAYTNAITITYLTAA